MAILKKRTSNRQLPSARGIDRAPLDSVIRGVDDSPFISNRGVSSLTSAGGAGGSGAVNSTGATSRPFTSAFSKPATTKPTLTTKTTSVPKTTLAPKTSLTSSTTKPTTTTKPTVTTKTSTTPATKTTSPTSVVKPTVKPTTTNTNSTANKVVNAVTGAALGVGTKLIIDKITGKPTVVKTDPAGSSTPNISGGAGAKKPPAANNTTSVVKPPVNAGDSNYQYPTNPSGGTPYDDEGNLMPGWQLNESNDPVWVGLGDTAPAGNVAAGDNTDTTVVGTGGTRGLGGNGTTSITAEDNTTVSNAGSDTTAPQYFQDELGNIYTQGADGSYTLFSEAGGGGSTVADNSYTDPDTGQVWNMADDGTWSMVGGSDTTAANTWTDPDTGAVWTMADDGSWNTDWVDNTDYTVADNTDTTDYTDYTQDEYAKSGGLITMMKQGGGIQGYAKGGGIYDTQYNDDGSYTIFYQDGSTDAYDENGDYYGSTPAETYESKPLPVPVPEPVDTSNASLKNFATQNPGVKSLANRSASDFGVIDSVDNGNGTYTQYYSDGTEETFDNPTYGTAYNPNGTTEAVPITSAGGGGRSWYDNIGSKLSKGFQDITGISDANLEKLTGVLPAAGAGALVATLLGQDFGGGTGAQNQGLDMSKVGLINPRTTDFGIGPTNFVGYDDYGTSGGDYTPNEELLRNLNAPGYNPVNEGDYGYEDVPVEEAAPKMASGGLSSMATPVASYYTFGQPADIMANLGMRAQPPMNPPEMTPQIGQQQQPQQTQQQGLPQQAPPQMAQQAPQGMPQQGMMPQQQGMPPPMRKGGLPHVSNVPLVEGRMDFRNGSAVHGDGDGQSDDIPAMLADGEYVIDAETVAQIGNGSTKAGAQALDKFRESIRAHKRSAPVNKIPPKTKALTSYLKGAK